MDEVSNYKGFVFYPTMRDSIEALSTRQGRELLWAIVVYGTTGEIIPCSKGVRAVLLSIIPNIDSQKTRYAKRAKAAEKAAIEPKTEQIVQEARKEKAEGQAQAIETQKDIKAPITEEEANEFFEDDKQ